MRREYKKIAGLDDTSNYQGLKRRIRSEDEDLFKGEKIKINNANYENVNFAAFNSSGPIISFRTASNAGAAFFISFAFAIIGALALKFLF